MKDSNWHYEVRPRYTAGPSGMVIESEARRVARQEAITHQTTSFGLRGAKAAKRAATLGLKGIVIRWRQHRRQIDVEDLITKGTATVKKLADYYEGVS